MSLGKKLAATIILTTITATLTARSDIPDGARAVAVSGGEEHTLVLTAVGSCIVR